MSVPAPVLTSPAVVAAFDLGGFRRLADLGGATGHLAIAACERYQELRGVVLELPPVVPFAREQVAKSAARDRIEVVAGDFFEGIMTTARADYELLTAVELPILPADTRRRLTEALSTLEAIAQPATGVRNIPL